MNCDKVLYKLSAYIDNELNDNEKQIIEQHVQDCSACAQELNILLKNEAYIKRSASIGVSADFYSALNDKLKTEKGKTGWQTGALGILARFWIPVPLICAAMIIAFVGFTSLSPFVYATADNLKNVSELSKSAFSNISYKNIAGPLNYMDFCNKCHMALCEHCRKGEACSCK